MPPSYHYRRHLPHQVPAGYPIFLTWNLKGSLPQSAIAAIELEEKWLSEAPLRKGEPDAERKLRIAKLLFVKRDQILGDDCALFAHDEISTSKQPAAPSWIFAGRPMWLADSRAACEVVRSLFWGVPQRYQLWAFVVMGNHVHCLLTPHVELAAVTQGIKGYTAFRINRIQQARGRVFWQDESYDRWPRDEDEFFRIIEYIERNPVVAKLCQQPEDWCWSSAAIRTILDWPRGQPFPAGQKEDVDRWLRTSAFPG